MSNEQTPTDPGVATAIPERFDPSTMHGELLEAEHLARYRWVSGLASGRRVLDAGCGAAYGTAILAEAGAELVTGVDVASAVLQQARAQMPDNVVLEHGDVTSLPFEDDRFDVVVCFEVIEHLQAPGRALDEFRRVLAPDGVVAVSSPNRDVYPPGNPHHLHEYTPPELEQELAARFAWVSLQRQHTWITSGVLDDEQFRRGNDLPLNPGVSMRKLVADEPGKELYTIALAGATQATPAAVFELTAPIELRKWDELWHAQLEMLNDQQELLSSHEAVFAEHALAGSRLQLEIDQLREALVRGESELARMPELDAQLRELLELNDELLAHNHELQTRQQHLAELEAVATRYAVLITSSSWRITRPLRSFGAMLRKLLRR